MKEQARQGRTGKCRVEGGMREREKRKTVRVRGE